MPWPVLLASWPRIPMYLGYRKAYLSKRGPRTTQRTLCTRAASPHQDPTYYLPWVFVGIPNAERRAPPGFVTFPMFHIPRWSESTHATTVQQRDHGRGPNCGYFSPGTAAIGIYKAEVRAP